MRLNILLYFFIINTFAFAQYNFSYTVSDTLNLRSLQNEFYRLSKQIIENVSEEDYINKDEYLDDLFRLNLLANNLSESQKQLDSLRLFYVKQYNQPFNHVGIGYESYLRAMQKTTLKKSFPKAYKTEINKLYKNLPIESKLDFEYYFESNLEKDSIDVVSKLKKNLTKSEAITLCRYYLYYKVMSKIQNLGSEYITKEIKSKLHKIDTVSLETRDGATVSAIILRPKTEEKLPTIINHTIYSNHSNNLRKLRRIAFNNYIGVISFSRGKFQNNNQTVLPFKNENIDINTIIEWIVKQPWSNGEVGMYGGSYEGFAQWSALKNPHPALKTIVPQAAVGFGNDFPLENGVFSSYSFRWLDGVSKNHIGLSDEFYDIEQWDLNFQKYYRSGTSFKSLDIISNDSISPVFRNWLAHSTYDEFYQNLVPYQNDYSEINIPILSTTGYFDPDQLGVLSYIKQHYKYNKNPEHYLIIGPYDHYGAQSYTSSNVKGYDIDDVAKLDFHKIVFEWFDYVLKNRSKPTILKGKINYQLAGSNQWKSVNSLDALEDSFETFYLNFDKQKNRYYSLSNKNKTKESILYTIDLSDRSDSLFFKENKLKRYDSSFVKKNRLIFETEELKTPLIIQGSFKGKLVLETNKRDFDLNIELIEKMPNGDYFEISNTIFRASQAKNQEKRVLLKPYKKEIIPINNSYFVSRKIEKGSKLLLTVSVNKSPNWQINYGSGKPVAEESIEDAGEPINIKFYNESYINIPISNED